MDLTLKKVSTEEFPKLLEWLEQHLPDSWRMYGLVREHVMGRWAGHSFLVLGWPENPQAVVEGDLDLAVHPCPESFCNPRIFGMYATTPEYAEIALTKPGIVDWSQSFKAHAVPNRLVGVVDSLATKFGYKVTQRRVNILMTAAVGYMKEAPIPNDLTLRPLRQKSDIEYALTTWPYATQNADQYFTVLTRRFPSVGLFDRDGVCHGLEMGRECGFMGMLYVREESRRRGFGQVLTTRLAQKYFDQGLPAVITVEAVNRPSVELHKKVGFKPMCLLTTSVYIQTLEDLSQGD